MMNKGYYVVLIAMLLGAISFSQSKRELMDRIAVQKNSIDSLNKVIANMENIIENRDRSIKFLQEDQTKLKEELQVSAQKVRKKKAIVEQLRKRAASGKTKIMTLSNNRSTLKVTEGTYWIINQFITDYTAGITTDSTGRKFTEEVHVFLKAIDDKVLTDPSKKIYGPKLYSSLHPEQTMQFPIILTENVRFSIIIFRGKIGELYPYEAEVYCSFTEIRH